jgi:hypothetical protein
MPVEKQRQTFLGQAFEDEPFGFAYDKDGNLIPGTEAGPLKVRMDDGRILTAAEAEAELFPKAPEAEEEPPPDDDFSDLDDLMDVIKKTAAPGPLGNYVDYAPDDDDREK